MPDLTRQPAGSFQALSLRDHHERRVVLMVKRFVLDTNILLQDPNALFGFADNDVILTSTTLQELDKLKTAAGEQGHHAREAIRLIEEARSGRDLVKGVSLKNGGTLFVEPGGVNAKYLPSGFFLEKSDYRIISSCCYLQERENASPAPKPVILVSNDIAMRISASVILGADHVEHYKNRMSVEGQEFTGHIDLDVPTVVIDALYRDGKWAGAGGTEKPWDEELTENLFVTLHAGQQSALSVYQKGALYPVRQKTLFGGIKPMNALQTYAIWALTNPDIPLVILLGPAGTAKTFLSLAAGLEQTYTSQRASDRLYQKMLISRPNAEAGDPGFGYLPGSLQEKMQPLLLPYYDNLENLFSGEDRSTTKTQVEDLFSAGVIELCALSFIRGRSLTNSFLICDEAQNATRLLIRDVVTRAGHGTKVVLAGDPEQVDSLYLDKYSNGLVFAAECFKDSPLAAVIRFGDGQSVRSPLAKEALRRMKI